MKVNVEYSGQLKGVLGITKETLELEEPCTVQKALLVLQKLHEPILTSQLPQWEWEGVFVAVDDVQAEKEDLLYANCTLSLFSAMAGG